MLFNSRSASSLFEADIGVAVREIMGIMNKVKHRPQGQYFSQQAGEKKQKESKRTVLWAPRHHSISCRQKGTVSQKHQLFGPMFISLKASNVCLQALQQGLSVSVLPGPHKVGFSPCRVQEEWKASRPG